MANVILLLDGNFCKRLIKSLTSKNISPRRLKILCESCLLPGETIIETYYYDCLPCGGKVKFPISKTDFDFESTPIYSASNEMLARIGNDPFFTLRKGKLIFVGWTIKEESINELRQKIRALVDNDFEPKLIQKQIDMMIGLDLTKISTRNEIDSIILITGDSDFVPAIQSARSRKKNVYLVTGNVKKIKKELLNVCSDKRKIDMGKLLADPLDKPLRIGLLP
jgi:predicted nuclease of predicted toxin-antitoxin system